MTYKEWEEKQVFSPMSPEAVFAERAWNAAVDEAAALARSHVSALLSGVFSSSEKQAGHVAKTISELRTKI